MIHHVPEVLYHWRMSDTSTASATSAKSYVVEAGKAAIADHLERRHLAAEVENICDAPWYRIKWLNDASPSVTIIIPFKEAIGVTRECLDRVLAGTDYSAFDVILVDNWSTSSEAADFCAEMNAIHNVQVLRVEEPFNYSRLNNLAAASSTAEFFVLMNNDLYVTDRGWLRTLVNEALADEQVAVVGGKYLYPNGTVQHAGVVCGIGGVAAHAHTGLTVDEPGYAARALFAREMSCVTAACLLIRSDVYRAIGGLDEEHLRVAFNDVDLCLKVYEAGFKVVFTPEFLADHHESFSRGDDEENPMKEGRFFAEMQIMVERWGNVLKNDPYYNPKFSLEGRPFIDLVRVNT